MEFLFSITRYFIAKILLLSSICFFSCTTSAKCPESDAEILVENDSPFTIRLETKEEDTCKLHLIADIPPGEKEKYFCVSHDYMLKVTTFYNKERKAVSGSDTWNDMIIQVKEGSYDVKFKHLRGEIRGGLIRQNNKGKVTTTKPSTKKWHYHKHDSSKHRKKDKDHSTESLLN
ncbi:MAG: hypothetical protein HRT87_01510 [Legionellales bacterium]|nr:hypothetical protein [Legionellales bacterium]